MPEQRIRAILAQRPNSGEMRVRKIPAWEKRREGTSRLPAGTSEAFSARKGDSLPRRDVVQTRAAFGACRAEILPSGDDVRAQATQRPGLGGLGSSGKEARAALAQRPTLEEERPHKILAWEKTRAAGAKRKRFSNSAPCTLYF